MQNVESHYTHICIYIHWTIYQWIQLETKRGCLDSVESALIVNLKLYPLLMPTHTHKENISPFASQTKIKMKSSNWFDNNTFDVIWMCVWRLEDERPILVISSCVYVIFSFHTFNSHIVKINSLIVNRFEWKRQRKSEKRRAPFH